MRVTGTRPEEIAKWLGVGLPAVYGWRRNRKPGRKLAAALEKVTGGIVKASGWD